MDVVTSKRNFVRLSSHLRHAYSTAAGDDALVALVISRLESGGYDLLVIGDEPALHAIYARSLPPSVHKYLPIPLDSPAAKTIDQKGEFLKWASAHNLPCPRTVPVTNVDEIITAGDSLGWPLMLKGTQGAGGITVFKVDGPADARTHAERIRKSGAWLAQTHVAGRVCTAQFFAVEGRLKAWFGVEKTVCLNHGKGPAVVGTFCNQPGLESLCAAVVEAARFTGISGFDYMESSQGELFIIDSHLGRCVAMSHFGLWCGVDFSIAIRDWSAGDNPARLGPETVRMSFVKCPEFLQYTLEQGLPALLRHAAPWRADVRYSWAPPKDGWLMLRVALDLVAHDLWIRLLKWRRRVSKCLLHRSMSIALGYFLAASNVASAASSTVPCTA